MRYGAAVVVVVVVEESTLTQEIHRENNAETRSQLIPLLNRITFFIRTAGDKHSCERSRSQSRFSPVILIPIEFDAFVFQEH